MSPKINLGPFHFSSTGVRIAGKPPIEEWTGPLQFGIWCQSAGPWWIGDMLNAGEDRFGEQFSQACSEIISAEQMNRYASVARRVPIENRRSGLSWSAHAAVARLPKAPQRKLLLEAEHNGWTSQQLRVKARELVPKKP